MRSYLCHRLYTLPEPDVEGYLSQLTQLCVSRPGAMLELERAITDLCAQSLRIAVKVGAGGGSHTTTARGGRGAEGTARRLLRNHAGMACSTPVACLASP